MKFVLIAFSLFVSFYASAQVISESELTTQWRKFKEGLVFSHFSILTGPGVRTGGSRKLESNGQPSLDPVSHWFQLTIGKKINNNITFAVNPRFTLHYGERPNGESEAELDDPVTGFIFNYKLSENVSYFGILNTVTGKVSESAREKNLLLNPGDFHEVTYRFGPAFDVAARTFFRMNVYSRNTNQAGFGGWIGPKVEYYFNDQTSFRYWLQQGFNQAGTNQNFFSTRDDGQNHFFSLHQKIHKTLGILPFIAIDTSESNATRNAYLGAWMYGSFL